MDSLSKILTQLNMVGTLHSQLAINGPWHVHVPDDGNTVRFHIVQSGHCYLRLTSDEEPVRVEQGEIILISHGRPHTLCSDKLTDVQYRALETTKYPESVYAGKQDHFELLRHNKTTRLICGCYSFSSEPAQLLLKELPAVIQWNNDHDEFRHWIERTLKLCVSKDNKPLPLSELFFAKTAEIALTMAIRKHFNFEDISKFQSMHCIA